MRYLTWNVDADLTLTEASIQKFGCVPALEVQYGPNEIVGYELVDSQLSNAPLASDMVPERQAVTLRGSVVRPTVKQGSVARLSWRCVISVDKASYDR